MANAEFHKAQAEELIKRVNADDYFGEIDLNKILALAQIHATLATIQEFSDED